MLKKGGWTPNTNFPNELSSNSRVRLLVSQSPPPALPVVIFHEILSYQHDTESRVLVLYDIVSANSLSTDGFLLQVFSSGSKFLARVEKDVLLVQSVLHVLVVERLDHYFIIRISQTLTITILQSYWLYYTRALQVLSYLIPIKQSAMNDEWIHHPSLIAC